MYKLLSVRPDAGNYHTNAFQENDKSDKSIS